MKISVVGLGYIGLPMSTLLASKHEVVGYDIDLNKVDAINRGELTIEEPGLLSTLETAISNGYKASTTLESSDVFIICVPTDVTRDKHLDANPLVSALEAVAKVKKDNSLIIIESTIGPRTCERVVIPIVGDNIAYCPERAIPGFTMREMVNNDRIVGINHPSQEFIVRNVYSAFLRGDIHFTTVRAAEMVKLSENTFRAVNLALSNELSKLAERYETDVWEVIRLANLHPRVNYLNPGPGVGGHCIPIDPYFLVDGISSPLIDTAMRLNDSQPSVVIDAILYAANMKTRNIALLGATYKADTDDTRNAPTKKIKEYLESYLMNVRVHDPHIEGPSLEECLDGADMAVVLVDHEEYKNLTPETFSGMNVKRIYDTRHIIPQWDGFIVEYLGVK